MPDPKTTELEKSDLLHIGRKCPKGYEELPNGQHLGKGIWLLRCKMITAPALHTKGQHENPIKIKT